MIPKGIVGDFEFKEFEVWKNDTRGRRRIMVFKFVSAKRKHQK